MAGFQVVKFHRRITPLNEDFLTCKNKFKKIVLVSKKNKILNWSKGFSECNGVERISRIGDGTAVLKMKIILL